MNLDYSAKTKELIARCETFMRDVVYPNEHAYLAQHAKQSDHWACPPEPTCDDVRLESVIGG
jgi:hypothetical protein